MLGITSLGCAPAVFGEAALIGHPLCTDDPEDAQILATDRHDRLIFLQRIFFPFD